MRGLFISVFQLFVCFIFAQDYPKHYFSSPLGDKLNVSSNFGKIRPNHFHSGIDINTKLKSGINIYAVAKGYISRVKISSTGYGKAIYITHPNGFVSVYAHLSEIEKNVAAHVYKIQHQKKQFEVDLNFPPGKFPIQKGAIIGKSGNTGRSYGAHLHFEIRDEKSELALNPLLFDFNVPDNEAPIIHDIYLYRFLDELKYGYYHEKNLLDIHENDTIFSFGKLGLGLELRDYLSKKKGNFDVYQLKLSVDDSLYFKYKFKRFAFNETNYINSFIDYSELRKSGKKIIKCYIEPNNKLNIYETSQTGLFDFSDGQLHKLNILAADIKGNATSFVFYIKSDSLQIQAPPEKSTLVVKTIDYSKIDEFATDSFRIIFNENCLYDYLDFRYFVSQGHASNYSKYHYVHNPSIPLHNEATIEIMPCNFPQNLKNKALIAGVGPRGRAFSVGGKWNNGFLQTNISNFGTYFIAIDTILPTIEPFHYKTKKKKKSNFLHFKIKDELSGIQEYVCFIDGEWILFEYDEKNNLISCNLPSENILEGRHDLILWVRDKCNNLTIYESEFVY